MVCRQILGGGIAREVGPGNAQLASTSTNEKLVCRCLTFGRFIRYWRAKLEKLSKACATTCNSPARSGLVLRRLDPSMTLTGSS